MSKSLTNLVAERWARGGSAGPRRWVRARARKVRGSVAEPSVSRVSCPCRRVSWATRSTATPPKRTTDSSSLDHHHLQHLHRPRRQQPSSASTSFSHFCFQLELHNFYYLSLFFFITSRYHPHFDEQPFLPHYARPPDLAVITRPVEPGAAATSPETQE